MQTFVYYAALLILIVWAGVAVFAVSGISGSSRRSAGPHDSQDALAALASFMSQCGNVLSGRDCRLVLVRGRLALVMSLSEQELGGVPLNVFHAPEALRASVGLFHDEQVELPLGKARAESVGEELAVGAAESVGLGLAVLLHDEGKPSPGSLGGGPSYIYLVAASPGSARSADKIDSLRNSFRGLWPAAISVAGEALIAEAAVVEPVRGAQAPSPAQPYPETPKRLEVVREVQVPSRELPFLRRDVGAMYPLDEPSQVPEAARGPCGAGAETDTPLILIGTPGVGKEFVARWYHSQSPLADGPFIKFAVSHCPPSLRQIELLGDEEERGCLGAARDGMLFVEGASELADQVLDRLLHDASISEDPLGLILAVRCPASVIPEDHLGQMRGSLGELARGILSHRVVLLPRLAETPERVSTLADFFMHSFAMKHNRVITSMTDEALVELSGRDWVAGVSELKAVVEAAVLRCETGVISSEDLRVGKA
ncbi:MAG: sigma 54-interacting transcriptional regulator [Deltaproteobacteria bacterium]|nr:sigma 54-interacting transcriptional regulator [Deltaproteobacteria bacterium]